MHHLALASWAYDLRKAAQTRWFQDHSDSHLIKTIISEATDASILLGTIYCNSILSKSKSIHFHHFQPAQDEENLGRWHPACFLEA